MPCLPSLPKRLQLPSHQSHTPCRHGPGFRFIVRHQQRGHAGRGNVLAKFLAQALALVVFVPWFAERSGWRLALAALWLLLSFPLLLLAMAWATGAMDAAHLSLMESALVGFAVLLLGAAKGLVRLTNGQIRRFVLVGLQLGVATLLWRFRETWLAGLGL